jgi:YD repeat-containing protein
LRRITSVTYPNSVTSSCSYDANGNRLTWARTGATAGTTSYTYDNADQLLTEGSITSTYDAAGNVTAKGGDSFTWDWNNRLTAATVGSTTTTYTYDGDDVRTRGSNITSSMALTQEAGHPLGARQLRWPHPTALLPSGDKPAPCCVRSGTVRPPHLPQRS